MAERNKLIHRWLAAFNPNSIESCVELAAAFDEQHARVLPEFEILKSLVFALKIATRNFVDMSTLMSS